MYFGGTTNRLVREDADVREPEERATGPVIEEELTASLADLTRSVGYRGAEEVMKEAQERAEGDVSKDDLSDEVIAEALREWGGLDECR